MGFFGPYKFKSKSGKIYYLHVKDTGKTRLYYFSKDQNGALNDLPRGYEVSDNPKSELPFLRKKMAMGLFGPKQKKEEQPEQPK